MDTPGRLRASAGGLGARQPCCSPVYRRPGRLARAHSVSPSGRVGSGRLEHVVRTVEGLGDVSEADWNACAWSDGEANPFLSWKFLRALEESRSVCADSGWQPAHVVLERRAGADQEVVGVCPLYVKGHSYGEYVFDHSWADAYQRFTGRRYYPKLQSCVPFTPCSGARLLARPPEDQPADRSAVLAGLAGGLIAVADQTNVSGVHVTFASEDQVEHFASDLGFQSRMGIQYHWHNRGYETFDDFLAQLRQSKRKAIRQERKYVREKSGLDIRRVFARDMTPRDWDAFYRFYTNTCDRKWGEAYLNREFFQILGETMGDEVFVVFAEDDGTKVAGALNLVGRNTIYGRNWGCRPGLNVKHLHFELCYYQAIDAAIELGYDKVEAGAQGEHKIQRGYLPSRTFSAHYIKHGGMSTAIEDFLARERAQIRHTMAALDRELNPYKRE